MSKRNPSNPKREIPAARVAAFIEEYISANYQLDESEPTGAYQFAFESGVNVRTLYRIRHGEKTNVSFEIVDDMLVALDREYLWHWGPEDGGFADYYADIPAAPAEPTIEQQRRNEIDNAKRSARAQGREWLEVLMERAQAQMKLQCA